MIFPKILNSSHCLAFIFFTCLSITSFEACDPILESLIFSRDRIEALDLELRKFSTLLNDLARTAREKKEPTFILHEMKKSWLLIYQGSWLNPPGWAQDKELWKQRLDEIAVELKKNTGNLDFESLHPGIIHIQNLLVDLYGSNKTRTLVEEHRFLNHLILLTKKSQIEKLSEDQLRIETRLQKAWQEYYRKHGSHLKSFSAFDWNQKLNIFLQMELKEYELSSKNFFHELDIIQFESMDKGDQ